MKKHLKQLFDLVMEQPESQREKVIDESEFDEEIKQQVKRMLKIRVDEVELTGTIIDSVQLGLDINPIEPGMKINSYILDKPLGQGGQGEVWLAHRGKGDFSHKVAIKFLKPVHNDKELQRFQNERELLAQLKHNNIAQLLGGGELLLNSSKPRPYMILELIEGLPLIQYCQQNNFSLKQYLGFFMQICDAISYAHSHRVIHRDIKPANIFVTHDGIVKLLDFGIAKNLQTHQDTQTVPMMTLAYSSPEQVSGKPVSTTTDVYLLGLLLYEMLTGKRAQASDTEVPSEVIHEITLKTPVIPSHTEKLSHLKRNYSNRHLKGDLDNIIMMALRKEPERRYPTVSALAADIQNFLAGRAVIATGDSHLYKIKKLIGRNPVLTGMSFILMCFLVILPVIQYKNGLQIQHQRDLEKAARIDEERTSDFLFNILESASPIKSEGEAVLLSDVLQSAQRQLQFGVENQPKLRSKLQVKLAQIESSLGHIDNAIDYYKKALETYIETKNENKQLNILAQIAVEYTNKGDPQQATLYRKQAENLSKKISDPLTLGWYHSRMATIDLFENKYDKVRDTLPEVIETLEKQGVHDNNLLGRLHNDLAVSYQKTGSEVALFHINQALKYAQNQYGTMHPKFLTRQTNKAYILIKLNQEKEAEELLLEVKDKAEKLFTRLHPEYVFIIGELANLYHNQGRFTETEELYKTALELSEKLKGEHSTSYLFHTNNLGYLYEDEGKYNLAELYYRKSLNIRKTVYKDNLPRIARSQANLARLLAKTGKFGEAQKLLNEAIPVYILNNLANLGNNITQLAIDSGTGSSCDNISNKIKSLIPEVEKLSEKNWRRMSYELWLGEIAFNCNDMQQAKLLLQAAREKSLLIYAKNSDGQIIVQSKTQALLHNIE